MQGERVGTAIVAIACVVLVAACGSSGSKGAKANPTKDRAAAQKLIVAQADLPSGWSGSADTEDAQDKSTNQKMSQCVGSSTDTDHSADVNGDDFDKGDAEISSEAVFAKTDDLFQQDVDALRGSKYETCIQQILAPELKQSLEQSSPGVQVGAMTITRFDAPKHGDVTEGFRLSVPITPNGAPTVNVYDDIIAYGANRAELTLGFVNLNTPFDSTLERSLADKVGARLEKS
jgi:hypothetical protein